MAIRVKSEHLVAVRLVTNLSPSSKALNEIAMEFARGFALGKYVLRILDHWPSVCRMFYKMLVPVTGPDTKRVFSTLVKRL